MALGLLGVLGASLFWLFYKGVGIWGINMPVAWGTAIHQLRVVDRDRAGRHVHLGGAACCSTRNGARRSTGFTEAMTLFALACAGLIPAAAPGPAAVRVFPRAVPEHAGHVAAVREPAGVGLLRRAPSTARFPCCSGMLGMIPDLATLRDYHRPRGCAGFTASPASAGAIPPRIGTTTRPPTRSSPPSAAPLVISVHSIVGLDFAYTILPGWHSTIFPPFFVVRRDLLGFRDGADAHRADPGHLRVAGTHHGEPPRQHGEAAAASWACACSSAPERIFHGVVQRRRLRAVPDRPGGARACIPLRSTSRWPARRWRSSRSGWGRCAAVRRLLFVISILVNVGHVGRAVPEHRRQPAPRLPDFLVGGRTTARSGTGARTSARSDCS